MKAIARSLMTATPLWVKQYINQHINYAGRVCASVKGQRTAQGPYALLGHINCLTNFTDNIRFGQRKWAKAMGIRVPGCQAVSHVTGSRSLFRTFVAAAEISQQGAAAPAAAAATAATSATCDTCNSGSRESGRYSVP